MTIKYHFFEGTKLGCAPQQLREVVELVRKSKIRFRREIEYVLEELSMIG